MPTLVRDARTGTPYAEIACLVRDAMHVSLLRARELADPDEAVMAVVNEVVLQLCKAMITYSGSAEDGAKMLREILDAQLGAAAEADPMDGVWLAANAQRTSAPIGGVAWRLVRGMHAWWRALVPQAPAPAYGPLIGLGEALGELALENGIEPEVAASTILSALARRVGEVREQASRAKVQA